MSTNVERLFSVLVISTKVRVGMRIGNKRSPFPGRALHKSKIFMEFTLGLFHTSSRAAERRGRYNIPKLSCPVGVDPGILNCFAMLAMTVK